MPMTDYSVQATNLSQASENRIHDDSVARAYGFSGALVPGVEVYAYACHQPVARWGIDFLHRGRMSCRFVQPVYDGRLVTVRASDAAAGIALEVASEGRTCATGHAELPAHPAAFALPSRAPAQPLLAERPAADAASLAPGRPLGLDPQVIDAERANAYLTSIGETDPLYGREGLVHPGLLLRLCNSALKDNVLLGPWVHTSSTVAHVAPARVGAVLDVRGHVAANYERKGHQLVDLDLTIVADGSALIAHVLHTAIYRLRAAV